jgi:hypothetical protein
MAKVIFRELLIFVGALSIFPVVVVFVLFYSDSWTLGRAFLSRELLSGGIGPGGTTVTLWLRLVSPYLVIQSIRAYLWSQRSLKGKKWGNLYFALLMTGLGGWSLSQAWDLWYFMYALGDMPAELVQFVQLEASNLILGSGSLVLAVYCFRIFLDPTRQPQRRPNDRVQAQ